jgi:hypothetical protein
MTQHRHRRRRTTPDSGHVQPLTRGSQQPPSGGNPTGQEDEDHRNQRQRCGHSSTDQQTYATPDPSEGRKCARDGQVNSCAAVIQPASQSVRFAPHAITSADAHHAPTSRTVVGRKRSDSLTPHTFPHRFGFSDCQMIENDWCPCAVSQGQTPDDVTWPKRSKTTRRETAGTPRGKQ